MKEAREVEDREVMGKKGDQEIEEKRGEGTFERFGKGRTVEYRCSRCCKASSRA